MKKVDILTVNRVIGWTFTFASFFTMLASAVVVGWLKVNDNWVFAGLIFGAILGVLAGRFYFKTTLFGVNGGAQVFVPSIVIGFVLAYSTGYEWWFYGFCLGGLVLGGVMMILAQKRS